MEEALWMQQLSGQNQLAKILEVNEYTEPFGLALTQEEARMLVQERRNSLKEQQRAEFGGGILPRLIQVFCDSPYIYQEIYAETLVRLQEIFYLYKNESLDELTDEELLAYMKKQFDGVCAGDMDYLEHTALEEFAREVRAGTQRFIGRYKRRK